MSSVNLQSLNELRGTLIRRGIPPRYVHRVTTELREHAEDLRENGESTETSLGEFSVLADEITQHYKARTFAGRHPWLIFGLLPLPFTILTYAAWMFVALVLPLFVLSPVVGASDVAKGMLVSIANVAIMLVPPMLSTWVICRVSRRAGLTWRLTFLACLPVFLVALHFVTQVNFVLADEVQGAYEIGFAFPLWARDTHVFSWPQLLQAAIPVLIVAGMMSREARRSPSLVT